MKPLLSFLLLLVAFSIHAQTESSKRLSYQKIDSLVMLSYKKGALKEAIPILTKAVDRAAAELGVLDSVHLSYLGSLGFFYSETGQYQKAEPLMLRLVDLNKQAENKAFRSTNNLSVLYRRMGKYEEAEAIYLKLLVWAEEDYGKEHKFYAATLNNLAAVFKKQGKLQEMEPLYLEACSTFKKMGAAYKAQYTIALNNLALLYQDMNRFAEAEISLKEVRELRRGLYGEDHPAYATAISNLADLYQTMKRYEEVEPLLLQAVDIKKKRMGELHPKYVNSLSSLAAFYMEKGDLKKAETLTFKIIELDQQIYGATHVEMAHSLLLLSKIYAKKDEIETALAYCLRSILVNGEQTAGTTVFAYAENMTQQIEVIKSIRPVDYLILATWNYENADKINGAILQFVSILKTKQRVLFNAGAKKEADEQLKAIFYLNKAALSINEAIRNDFAGKENKLRVLESNGVFAEMGIEVVARIGDAAGYADAFHFAEQNKSILLADAVKGNRARTLGDLPDSLAFQEIAFQKKRDRLKKKKYQAKSPSELTALLSVENKLNAELQVFLTSLKDKYPQYHRIKYENITTSTTEIQAVLPRETMLLEYFVGKKATYLFALTHSKVELYTIDVSQTELKKEIKSLRYALSNYDMILSKKNKAFGLYTEAAHWFYTNLLRPALTDTTIQNLIVITDGELGHLPFETFLVEAGVQGEANYQQLHYLMNDYNISYNYSATLLVDAVRKSVGSKTENNHQLLACAAAYEVVDSSLLNLRVPHLFNLRNRLNALPAAESEVKELSKFFAGNFLQGMETNEAFFKANAHQYGVIHLAMHGILHPRVPMLSSLAFTENRDSLEDNFLQAFEIAHLHLNADLVVLSACETGYGEFEQGEGVLSMARSFMYAGVPSLVVSLWQVNDQSTAAIMGAFYKNLANGEAKDAALRQAKLDYIQLGNGGLIAHPAFWSAFIQLGDNRPIILAKKGNRTGLLYGGLGLLVLIVVGLIYKSKNKAS